MRFLAGENFPRPALEALRKAGWDVFSIAEKCPGISDDEVIALSGSLPNRRGMPPRSHWRWSTPNRILPGLSAPTRVIGFGFVGWASPAIKGRLLYKGTLFFLLDEEYARRVRPCAERVVVQVRGHQRP